MVNGNLRMANCKKKEYKWQLEHANSKLQTGGHIANGNWPIVNRKVNGEWQIANRKASGKWQLVKWQKGRRLATGEWPMANRKAIGKWQMSTGE